jgi:precorrin-2/cobalt-factor-2 C20-methyltransferase
MTGILYAIGAGPGDPELISVKGLRILREANVVFLPSTREGHSFARSIIQDYLQPERQQIVELVCPPYRDRDAIRRRWEELAIGVAARLSEGDTCAFVCEGDPSLYSTFFHLQRGLVRTLPGAQIRVVPGVNAVSAAAALAAFPLATWDERLLIAPFVYQGAPIESLFEQAETVALLKPGRSLPALLDTLERLGSGTDSALVRRAGRPEQEVITDRQAMRRATEDYFTTLLLRRARA